MSSSNCCFLTCIQISQEADHVVWYSSPLFYQSAGFPNKVTIPFPNDLSLHLLTSHVVSNISFINTYCCRLTIGVPKCICWNLIPNIVVLRSGAFKKLLDYEGRALMNEIQFSSVAQSCPTLCDPMNEISVPVKQTWDSSLAFLPGEIKIKLTVCKQVGGPYQNLNRWAHWSWTSRLQNCE